MDISRRTLMGATPFIIATGLTACGGQTVAQIAAQVTADVDAVAQALESQLPAFQSATSINTATAAKVTKLVQQIVASAANFATVVSVAVGQPIVQQIADDFSALQQALNGFSLPAGDQTVLTAAAVLLPVIEAGVGIFAAAAPSGGMTVAQARSILLAAAR